nr:DNA polymerase alpha catalytic subunit [Tanacetum cinerariifolium]
MDLIRKRNVHICSRKACTYVLGRRAHMFSEGVHIRSNEFDEKSHLVVSCVCASIEGTSPSMLADCLGLDPSKLTADFVKLYCDDETWDYTTRSLNLRVIGDSERGTICPNHPRCNGRLVRQSAIGEGMTRQDHSDVSNQ